MSRRVLSSLAMISFTAFAGSVFSQGTAPTDAPLLRPPAEALASTVKLTVFKAEASSVYKKASAMRLIDRKGQDVYAGPMSQGWIGREGDKEGAWVELYLDQPCVVSEIAIQMGTSSGYHDQVRKAKIIVGPNLVSNVQFKAEQGWQRVAVASGRTDRVRLVVEEVLPSTRPTQTVGIYEMEVYGHSCT